MFLQRYECQQKKKNKLFLDNVDCAHYIWEADFKQVDMLTGKSKDKFKQWYVFNPQRTSVTEVPYSTFCTLPFSMQYGVYVDFFDSVGIHLSMNHYNNYWFDIRHSNGEHILTEDGNETSIRHEARIKAIEKANEIYNNK